MSSWKSIRMYVVFAFVLHLQHNNQGALMLYFSGRYHMVCAQFPQAITALERSISVQSELTQLHHLCYWDLM